MLLLRIRTVPILSFDNLYEILYTFNMILEEKIGLIAGKGMLPVLSAQGAKKLGKKVYAVGLNSDVENEIKKYVYKLKFISTGRLGSIIEFFKRNDITKVIMVGLIKHKLIFDNIEMDDRTKRMFDCMKDKKADSILGAVCKELQKDNLELIPVTEVLDDSLVPRGMLTGKRHISRQENEDIMFGFDIAKRVGGLDIGQTIVVKDKSIVAIEAMEGTDMCILRAGEISGGGFVVVKVAKPQQDWRFDLPVIGMKTIKTIKKAKGKILAVESGKTLILEKEKTIKLADKEGVIVVGI